jgi:hypothetical protein
MPTVFKNITATEVGTTPVDVLQIEPGVRATVIGCNLANTTTYDTLNVNVYVVDENSTAALYGRNIVLPPNTTLKLITSGEKLILPETAGLRVACNVDHALDVVVSYVEIS